jgi:hypothetical protein
MKVRPNGWYNPKRHKKTVVQKTGQYEIERFNNFLGNMINDTHTENQEIQRTNYANGIYFSLMCSNLRTCKEKLKYGYTKP